MNQLRGFQHLPVELHNMISEFCDLDTINQLLTTSRRNYTVYNPLFLRHMQNIILFPIIFPGRPMPSATLPDESWRWTERGSYRGKKYELRIYYFDSPPLEKLAQLIGLWEVSGWAKGDVIFALGVIQNAIYRLQLDLGSWSMRSMETPFEEIYASTAPLRQDPTAILGSPPPSLPTLSKKQRNGQRCVRGNLRAVLAIFMLFAKALGPNMASYPMIWRLAYQNAEVTEYLLRQCYSDSETYLKVEGLYLLHLCLRHRSISAIRILLEQGIDPNCALDVNVANTLAHPGEQFLFDRTTTPPFSDAHILPDPDNDASKIVTFRPVDYIFSLVPEDNCYRGNKFQWQDMLKNDLDALEVLLEFGAIVDLDEVERRIENICESAVKYPTRSEWDWIWQVWQDNRGRYHRVKENMVFFQQRSGPLPYRQEPITTLEWDTRLVGIAGNIEDLLREAKRGLDVLRRKYGTGSGRDKTGDNS
ncbi:hypothetical protein BJ508DRAFT_93730 [Ascobolus immersus RN42]|uniref:Uncharacterized protein n=1 Tax=Ascobolus immersus RN42 TaxID=1160509 RepID=A0A3N4IDP3_ASCIM|nr:hypothetical protein BJ508DRAFT_93730 [Ascobolus immersus RN42]